MFVFPMSPWKKNAADKHDCATSAIQTSFTGLPGMGDMRRVKL